MLETQISCYCQGKNNTFLCSPAKQYEPDITLVHQNKEHLFIEEDILTLGLQLDKEPQLPLTVLQMAIPVHLQMVKIKVRYFEENHLCD